MTRKHYIVFANVFSNQIAQQREMGRTNKHAAWKAIANTAHALCIEFRADNNRFDSDRFIDACNLGMKG